MIAPGEPLAGRLIDPQGQVVAGLLRVDARGRLTEVRPWRVGDPPCVPGLLSAGLVNAHLHLELGPGGARGVGFLPWLRSRWGLPPLDRSAQLRQARGLVERGTAAVYDVSNRGDTDSVLLEAGLGGLVGHEHLGFQPPGWLPEPRITQRGLRRVGVRAVPHAPTSCSAALVQRAGSGRAGFPSTLHVAETREELELLASGEGPFAELLDQLERPWRPYHPPGVGPVGWLDRLGLLGPGLVLVHGVHLRGEEVALLAARRAPLVLCLRSNLWIGGQAPPIDALRRAGVTLALGTDSLASNHDLDLLAELVAWVDARPDLPRGWLWSLATAGGADALGAAHLGRLVPGASPGVLQVDLDHLEALGGGPPPACRFLIPPAEPEETWPTPW